MKEFLIISDDISRRQNLLTILGFIGENCQAVNYGKSLEALQSSHEIEGVFIDATDCSLAFDVSEKFPLCPFILLNMSGDEQHVLPNIIGELVEPVTFHALTKMIEKCRGFLLNKLKKEQRTHKTSFFRSLVGESLRMQDVRKLIDKVAPTEANVLILGESGSGKEVIARNVHYLSTRRDKPFVPVNCGAIPDELMESELFGHEKGAFTGALSARKGRFELAEGGTLFLDEIGDMPLPMQVKLLRVLQERSFERVGGNKTIKCDVRIVAATHRNLDQMIDQERFREDLYYRLNVFPIKCPALRERQEDIPLILQNLIPRFCSKDNQGIKFTHAALQSLFVYPWPGNVRELSNLVERLTILYPNKMIDVFDLPIKYQSGEIPATDPKIRDVELGKYLNNDIFDGLRKTSPAREQYHDIADDVPVALPLEGVSLKEYLSKLEVNLIVQALEQSDWIVVRAATQLGIRRTTLIEKMRKYDISR
jgi:sigma-54 specific flagellar transcriptional regulator A